MNINFPDAPLDEIGGIRIATQGKMEVTWEIHERHDPVDHTYYWLRAKYVEKPSSENSDLVLLEQKKFITITPLQNRQEHSECFKQLEGIFSKNA